MDLNYLDPSGILVQGRIQNGANLKRSEEAQRKYRAFKHYLKKNRREEPGTKPSFKKNPIAVVNVN